jgi:hypothetical protein
MTNQKQIMAVQTRLGIRADGLAGPVTWGAIYRHVHNGPQIAAETLERFDIPNDTQEDIERVYGAAGDESKLVRFYFPYPMKLYGEKPIKYSSCHKLVKKDLELALKEIHFKFGMDYIKRHHLDHYYGCFNDRNTRGGSSKSHHAWGIAIDLAADINGNKTRKPEADMPWEVVEVFESYGWKSGGRAWDRDFMHFQRTKP